MFITVFFGNLVPSIAIPKVVIMQISLHKPDFYNNQLLNKKNKPFSCHTNSGNSSELFFTKKKDFLIIIFIDEVL